MKQKDAAALLTSKATQGSRKLNRVGKKNKM